MAKLKPSLIQISGQHGHDVLVDSKRYGPHIRKAVSPGLKRNEPALKAQFSRTKYLNQLASEVNRIVQRHADDLKPSTFYEELHKRFRKEPINNRYLLLLQLKGMEVNPVHPLSKLGAPNLTVRVGKTKLVVTLQVKDHPRAGTGKADCYDYKLLLVTWGKAINDKEQLSDWVEVKSGRPEFDFEFDRKADVKHWLLFLRLRLGNKNEPVETLDSIGMQVIDAGTFEKKDLDLLKLRKRKRNRTRVAATPNQKAPEIKRVKARRIL